MLHVRKRKIHLHRNLLHKTSDIPAVAQTIPPLPRGSGRPICQPFSASCGTLDAVAALVSPPSTTARTIASRPLGVRRAFLWMSIRSSANRYVWQHQLSRPGPNGQPPESSQLANFAPLDVSRARCRPNHRKIGQKPTVATRWRPNGAPLSLLARWVKSWFSFQMLTGAAEGIRTPDP